MRYCYLLLTFLLPLKYTSLYAQLELNAIFTDNMVIQRDVQVPIWGKAAPKETLSLVYNGITYKIQADKLGNWRLDLPAVKAGGPYSIKISTKKETRELKNILVGDVWLASGQSNMEWVVRASNQAEMEIKQANDPAIRHFKVPHGFSELPQQTLDGGPWEITSSETVGDFSAVGYFFARELRKHQNVPIGILNSSWGGSRIEPWMSAEALGYTNTQDILAQMRERQAQKEKATREKLEKLLGSIPAKDEGLQNGRAIWAENDYSDASWLNMKLPTAWENAGLSELDGFVWFRKTITLSAADLAGNATLSLGPIDDSDITWVNGKKVGETTQRYDMDRVYTVPASYLLPGVNVITVRVDDTGGGGGINGDAAKLFLKTAGTVYPLAADWKYKVGEVRLGNSAVASANQTPMLLYNKMIHPILNFPIKGVIWYQGESNAGGTDALAYRKLFPQMIQDWRSKWANSGAFPFLFVQLANFMQAKPEPAESSWAVLRESQLATLSLENTGQAVIIDIGEANDIHPRNKQDVGYRLALAARKIAYGEQDLVYSGPVFKEMKLQGDKVRLSFDHVGKGLTAKDKYGYLKGFSICGVDKKYVWAKALIEGDEIIVWNESVKGPIAVRYAWADNPDDANLYNAEGLPASPFRTDKD